MFGTSYRNDDLTYERDRADRLQYELEGQRRRQDEERQTRRREREEERRQELCEARDWPDAFSKCLVRARHEAAQEAADNRELADDPTYTPSHFFADWVREVERAQEIYRETEAELQERIAELRRQHVQSVANRLEGEFGGTGTVQALRSESPAYLVEW